MKRELWKKLSFCVYIG